MSSTPTDKSRPSLTGVFARLPRLGFSRKPPATEAQELSQSAVAYGVRSGDTLRREFDNRKSTLSRRGRS